jgi:hypothetical protein
MHNILDAEWYCGIRLPLSQQRERRCLDTFGHVLFLSLVVSHRGVGMGLDMWMGAWKRDCRREGKSMYHR